MMADIIEDDNEEVITSQPAEPIKDKPKEGIEATLKPIKEAEPSTNNQQDDTADDQDSEIPDKYRGKSIKDIIAMHQNAERHIGSQSSEVGELRRIVDEFIMSQSSQKESEEKKEEPDFFTNPTEAIKSVLDNDPVRQEMATQIERQKQEAAVQTLLAKHPNLKETFGNEQFQKWVTQKQSRLNLLSRTDQYDLEAADELLDLWSDYSATRQSTQKQVANDAVQSSRQERDRQLAAANTGKVQTSSRPGQGGKPHFRRADIVKLATTDPDRYEQLEDEILEAYREGRVK